MFKKLSISQGITVTVMSLITVVLLIVNIILITNFQNSILDNVKYSSREINKQIIMNYENYIDEVIQTSNYISQKTISYTEVGDLVSLESIYLQAKEINSDIVSIVLLAYDGSALINSNNQTISSNVNVFTWFVEAKKNQEIFYFSAPHIQDIFTDSTQQVITISKVISYYNGDGVLSNGVLSIDLTTDNIISLAKQTNLGENGHIVIINDESEYIYSDNNNCSLGVCDSIDMAESLIFGGDIVVVDNTHMYLNVNTLNHTRWRIATFINIENVYNAQKTNIIITLSIFLAALVTSYVVAISFSKRISNPMYKLAEHMNKMGSEYLVGEIKLKGQKEVVQLSETFNDMIHEIRSLMDRLVTEQKEKRKSEFFALQMQINPHFLYNTLDSIVWLAEKNRNNDVIEMVIALSKFFRISISKGKNVIPVRDEIEHAKNYLHIQKIRYNRQFDFKFNIDKKIYDFQIVKLILQPIIENAINHGISSEEHDGFISINAKVEKDYMIFDIINNGYGLTDDQISSMYENMKVADKVQSVGLRNVYQRLKLYYGDLSDIRISSVLDEYTCVSLIIPIRKENI
jgi:two-component system sensor histidine kinase YesM